MHTIREASKTLCADVYRLANAIPWCLFVTLIMHRLC